MYKGTLVATTGDQWDSNKIFVDCIRRKFQRFLHWIFHLHNRKNLSQIEESSPQISNQTGKIQITSICSSRNFNWTVNSWMGDIVWISHRGTLSLPWPRNPRQLLMSPAALPMPRTPCQLPRAPATLLWLRIPCHPWGHQPLPQRRHSWASL